MTAVALRIDGFFSPHTDRAISDTAIALQDRLKEVCKQISDSETLGRHYRETLEGLLETYGECMTKDWDGYSAAAVSFADFLMAARFARTLPTSIPIPEISADPDGELAFEWYNEDRDVLSVSIGRQGKISYAARFGMSRVHGTEYFVDELPPVITENLERLFS